jgi:hypothetical protein
MRHSLILLALVVATAALAAAAHAGGAASTTSQVVARFKAHTGDKLLVNKRLSSPGRYVALDLGAPSISRRAKYGTFTVYVLTGRDVDKEAAGLLADAHTGTLGQPGPGNIHWEPGTTLRGDRYWLAKRRYGGNVVLYWIGSSAIKKTDASFRRLHKPLTAITTG